MHGKHGHEERGRSGLMTAFRGGLPIYQCLKAAHHFAASPNRGWVRCLLVSYLDIKINGRYSNGSCKRVSTSF